MRFLRVCPSVFYLLMACAAETVLSAPVEYSLPHTYRELSYTLSNATASGTTTSTIYGKAVQPYSGDPDPQTDPIGLHPNAVTSIEVDRTLLPVDAAGLPRTASMTVDNVSWEVLSLQNISLELLRPFIPAQTSFDPIVLETNSPLAFSDTTVKVTRWFELQQLQFFQSTGSAAIGPGGTFALPGTMRAVVNEGYDLDFFGGAFSMSPAPETRYLETPFTLTGWVSPQTLPGLAPDDLMVILDGHDNLVQFDLSELRMITYDSFGVPFDLTMSHDGTLNYLLEYHMEVSNVPEPGTVALFGLGMIGLLPAVWRRMRRHAV